MNNIQLIEEAKKASKFSYSPYSGFSVGAALLSDDGELFTGCNIENASYGATCCAERTALFKAVSSGKKRFCKIAVAGSADGSFAKQTPPCGMCLQALSEFCSPDFEVILTDAEGVNTLKLSQLMPQPFDKGSM